MTKKDKVEYRAYTALERAALDSELMNKTGFSPCLTCEHYWGPGADGVPRCFAFSWGIPDAMRTSRSKHDVPRRDLGQKNDIVYERKGGDGGNDIMT